MRSSKTSLKPLEILPLLRDCNAESPDTRQEARQRFLDEFAEDIYNFPVKIYRMAEEEAGDFYVYVFENDRIFSRVKKFRGYNNRGVDIQFRTFLSFYVLNFLFLEWLRTHKEPDTCPLPPGDIPEPPPEGGPETSEVFQTILQELSPQEQLLFKLLFLAECQLSPEDLRLLSEKSGRPLDETLARLDGVLERLREKDERFTRLDDDLDSVWGWIVLRQKEWQELQEQMLPLERQGDIAGQAKLRAQVAEVDKKIAKRSQQRERIIGEIRSLKLTPSYRDMADVLNCSIGTVQVQLSRLRERLLPVFGPKKEE